MSGTVKSGIVAGLVGFLANLTLGILLPLCGPFFGLIWGAGAGILSLVWIDVENRPASVTRVGAKAGAIAGISASAGLMLGMIIQFAFLGGQETATALTGDLSREFGLPAAGGDMLAVQQWIGVISMGCCLSLLNLGAFAGAGALAARIFANFREI